MAQIMTTTTNELLSYDELVFTKNLVITAIDSQLIKIIDEESIKTLIDKLFYLHQSRKIYTFFITYTCKETRDDIFTNEDLTDFVLNVTDYVSFNLSFSTYSKERLINTVVQGLCDNRTDISKANNSFIPKEINSSIYLDRHTLKLFLLDNFWLVVLFLILMHLDQTEVFKGLISS